MVTKPLNFHILRLFLAIFQNNFKNPLIMLKIIAYIYIKKSIKLFYIDIMFKVNNTVHYKSIPVYTLKSSDLKLVL